MWIVAEHLAENEELETNIPTGRWIVFSVPQEHLQELRKQYRGRVEAMRGQVQQLTARHEACKKELAASETVRVRVRVRVCRAEPQPLTISMAFLAISMAKRSTRRDPWNPVA